MGLISRVSSRTYRNSNTQHFKKFPKMLVRQSRRALSYTLARKEYSDTSGADGIGRGLKTNFNFPEGTEHTRWQGARHDSPEWWRKLNMFYMTCQHYPTIGLLYNDRYPLDQEYPLVLQNAISIGS